MATTKNASPVTKTEETEAALNEGAAKATPTNVKRYQRAMELLKEKAILDKEINEIKAFFIEEMDRKHVNSLTTKDGLPLATRITTHRTEVDTASLWKEFPELQAIYTSEKDGTRFDWKKGVL